jgi:murein DD-endopeptidase MepM/ murein hydrolase activator NlpD
MSSLHQDRLLAEGPKPRKGTPRTPAPAQGKIDPPVATAEEKAPAKVPTSRSGKPRTRTSRTTAAPRKTARTTTAAKTATTAKAAAKPATKATAKPSARTPAKAGTSAKPKAPAKATAPAQPAGVERTVAPATDVRRPTPYKRPVEPAEGTAPLVLAPEVDVAELVGSAETQAREQVVETARPGRFRRRLPTPRRRPALFLAAAMVGALGVSMATGEPQPARAETATVSHSVSVAEQLGIEAQPIEEITPEAATERLGELAASRTERDEERAHAALVQSRADLEASRAAAAAAAEAARPDAVLPVQGARLTSGFGARWGTLHAGIDLAAPMMTPEYAVMDGIVLEAGPASGYGNAVYIQHENGDVTVYGHMEQILVSAGQVVRAGDTIALLGSRGQSTGPHLHFEVHVGGIDGTKIDPVPWLRERGVDI